MEEKKMSKSSISVLAKGLAEKSAISQSDAENFIKAMFDVANGALQDNSKLLKVKWLGTFKVTSIKERESVDVNTGDRILIEGRDKITFTPDNILKEIVNKPFAQFETVVVNDGVDFSAVDEKFSKLEEQNYNPTILESSEPEVSEPQNIVSKEVPEETAEVAEEKISEPAEVIVKPTEVIVESTEETVREEDKEAESNDLVEQVSEEKVEVKQTPLEKPLSNDNDSLKEDAVSADNQVEEELSVEDLVVDRHHVVLPKRLVAAVSVVFVILVAGMCWFAFNYGKLAAQRDHLALQLTHMQQTKTQQSKVVSKPQQPTTDKEQEILRQKAIEDSVRLAKAHEAVKMAEQTEQAQIEKTQTEKETSKQQVEKKVETSYDADPRIRTGAYKITGVAHTITVKSGETLSSLSKRYLGPGMECYLEAINDTKQVKVGQKIKIPKLEIKKKSKSS